MEDMEVVYIGEVRERGRGSQDQDSGLSFFVGFSSVSALVGLSRGTSYSASNAYLDGLGLWRQAANKPFVSLNLGPVAEVGMATKDS